MIYDVIVVGSGPGGAIAAAKVAKAGKSVLLVDRQAFPRDKICGDALPPDVLKMLRQEFNLRKEDITFKHLQLTWVSIQAPGGRVFRVPETPSEFYTMISPRFFFDHFLHELALRQGAHFEVMNIAKPLIHNDKVIGVVERRGKELIEHEAKVVIAADGASSAIASGLRGRVSTPEETAVSIRAYARILKPIEPIAYFYFQRHLLPGYAWIFAVSHERVNTGIYLYSQQHYKRMGQNLRTILDHFVENIYPKMPMELETETIHSWAIPFWTGNDSRVVKGAYLVGDAGRFVDVLTGGGIHTAMVTGKLAGEAAISIMDGSSAQAAASAYDSKWKREIGGSLRKFHLVQQTVGSRAFAIDAIAALGAFPPLRKSLLKSLAGKHGS